MIFFHREYVKFQTRMDVEVLIVTYNKGESIVGRAGKIGRSGRVGGGESLGLVGEISDWWRGSFFRSCTIGINVPHYRSIKAPLTPFKSFRS